MAKEKISKTKHASTKKQQDAPTIVSAPFVVPKWLPLTLILIATTLLHLQYLDIPLERDESIYTYFGKLALNGGKPYVDFYEMKPPVMFYSYAFLIALFGYSATGVHLAVTALAVVNTLFTFLIARKVSNAQGACLAATAYALWSLSTGVYGVYLMGETVALAWSLPAVLLALNYPDHTYPKQLFSIGCLVALAFLVKQTAGVVAISIGLYWVTHWFIHRKTVAFSTFFMPILWTFLGFSVPIALTIVGLWVVGSQQEAAFWLFDYPRLYASAVSTQDAALAFALMRRLVFSDYEGYFIAAILGVLAVSVSRRTAAQKALLVSWAVCAVATVALGNRFYGHYWLIALPVLSIVGALFFQDIIGWLRQRMGHIEANLAVLVAAMWSVHVVFIQPSYYFNPPLSEISARFSPGNPYVEHQILSNYMQKITKPTDRIAVLGSDPQYFIYLQKPSPIRHVYMPYFVNGAYPQAMAWQNETLQDFKTAQPEYVIFNKYPIAWMYQPNNSQWLYEALYTYMMQHYELVAFIENPGTQQVIEIKEPTNGGRIPAAPTYISVMKRR